MIMDACVLIDFLQAERTVFQLVTSYVGPVYVVSPIIEELRDINGQEDLIELGVLVIEPEIEDIYTAAGEVGALSFQFQVVLADSEAPRHDLCNERHKPSPAM